MDKPGNSLETVWDGLLSRLPEQVQASYASLDEMEKKAVLDHLDKIESQLGWHPEQSLGSGLQKTIQWYLSNPEWVVAIQQQHDYQQWLERNYDKRQ